MNTPCAVLAVAATLCVAACEKDEASLRVEPQKVPFYYYQSEEILLAVDSTVITVEADSATVRGIVAASTTGNGARVDSATTRGASDFWILYLRPGTTAQFAASAARALRLYPGIRFASNAYRLQGASACLLELVNRLLVAYQPSVTEAQMAALNANAGLTVSAAPTDITPWWSLRYPVRSQYTPLEIAAAMHRHPYVQLAEADMYSCISVGAAGKR